MRCGTVVANVAWLVRTSAFGGDEVEGCTSIDVWVSLDSRCTSHTGTIVSSMDVPTLVVLGFQGDRLHWVLTDFRFADQSVMVVVDFFLSLL